ncbi:unnamed protein product [Prorocentrum cordatum]|uniref:Uncharacterized protein n=1 Tax=Prorocentrum cordatum TaxID=2364126 RepID=A0ABN9YCE1_9DINO|nr:unnamed protein product [Polarella glacialis]
MFRLKLRTSPHSTSGRQSEGASPRALFLFCGYDRRSARHGAQRARHGARLLPRGRGPRAGQAIRLGPRAPRQRGGLGVRARGRADGDELEALAVPPMELTATVPEKHEEGEKVTIAGPHGPMEVVPPKGSKPGAPFTYRLTPMFEFRVEVPPGAKPGLQIECTRRDGVRVAIGVPPNLKPGDFFEVLPPALIVRVPDDAKAGDLVVFRPVVAPGEQLPPHIARSWIRTRVPEGLEPKQYFPARLPVPTAAPAGEAEGAGALGSVRKLFVPSGGRSAPGSEAEAKEPGSSADKEGTAPLLGKEEMSVGA